MSEDGNKLPRKCKSESRASTKQTTTKKRRIQPRRTLKEKNSDPASDKASTSASLPVKFSIQVEVESCDEDWWYKEDTQIKEEQEDYRIQDEEEQEGLPAKQPLNVQNQSDGQDQHSHKRKLKFAYLEALNRHGVIEKLEESSSRQINQSVTLQMESLLKIKQEPPEDLKWIKQEIVDENIQNEDDLRTCENLTEHLGITIKEEPLAESINEDQDLIDTNSMLLKVDSVPSINPRDVVEFNELSIDDSSQAETIKKGLNQGNLIIPELLENPDSSLTIWDVASRYFDLALKKAVHPSYVMIDYFCGLCRQADYGSDMVAFRSHLNEAHLSEALVLNIDSSAKDAVTIKAEVVSSTDKRYVDSLRAACVDLQLERSYLKRIVECLFRKKNDKVWQILSYKCYICELCYEHLSHFIVHLTTKHNTDYWQVSTEKIRSGIISVIVFKTLEIRKEFPVMSDETNIPSYRCLKCKLDFLNDRAAFFKHGFELMKCFGCKWKFSCHGLHSHIGQCQKFFNLFYPKTCPCKKVFDNEAAMDKHQKICTFGDTTLAFNCLVCNFVATTLDILYDHQRHSHTVRSDQIVFSNWLFGAARRIAKPKPKPNQMKEKKKKEKPVQVDMETIILTEGFCPICPFRLPGENLLQHLKTYHLVRSDVEVKPLVNCKWCDGGFSGSEVLYHTKEDIVPHDESCIVRHICWICYTIFKDSNALELHLITKHVVRSFDAIHQGVTKCDYCLTMYPGPLISHHCPNILDSVQCFYCHQQFQNYLFLTCHLNGHPSVECTNCKRELQHSCMMERHRLTCERVNMIVHECLKCGFREEEMWAIHAHCMECFSKAERTARVFLSRELIIQKPTADPLTISTDPSDDHSYTKRGNPTSTGAASSMEMDEYWKETQNAVSAILCTEVYEEIDEEYTEAEKEKNVAYVTRNESDGVPMKEVEKVIIPVITKTKPDNAETLEHEGTSEVGNLDDSSKVFVPFKAFAQDSQIKTELMEEEEEFVVTKVTDIKTDLSVEDFIENNSEVGIEPEVLLTINHAARKLLCLSKCRHCPFEGTYAELKIHLESCDNLDEKTPLYNASLPPECLQNCSFRCHVCCIEYDTLQNFYKHVCARSMDCPCCGKEYNSLGQLERHLTAVVRHQYVERSKYPLCMQCTKRVRASEVFNHWLEHSISVKSESRKESEAAVSWGYSDPTLKRHMHKPLSPEILRVVLKTLTKQMRYRETFKICVVCEKTSYRKREHKIHLIEHLLKDALVNKRAFGALRCQLCSKEYAKAYDYKLHMRQHGRLPIYQCSLCDKNFSDSSNLAKHRKVHNVEVKICDLCGRKFTCKIMLMTHLRLHETVVPVKCEHCEQTFLFPSQLKRHLKYKHRTGPVTYSCPVCHIKLNSMKLKWEHEWEVHRLRKISADCPVCGEQFRKTSDVKQHLRLRHDLDNRMATKARFVSMLASLAKASVSTKKLSKASERETKSLKSVGPASLNNEEGSSISWEIGSTENSQGSAGVQSE